MRVSSLPLQPQHHARKVRPRLTYALVPYVRIPEENFHILENGDGLLAFLTELERLSRDFWRGGGGIVVEGFVQGLEGALGAGKG
jgi:hypothetical protein